MNGGVPNKESCDILDQLSSTRDPRNILDQLASNSNSLDDCNYVQYIMFLLRAGADQSTKIRDGKTQLDYFNEKLSGILDHLERDINLLDYPSFTQIIIALLGVGASPDVYNQVEKKTLLHYVAEHNDTGGMKFFLDAETDSDVQDQSGRTPLHYVAERNNIDGIKIFLDAGADLNVQDQSGRTPLHYVAEHNNIEGIKFFFEAGADLNVRDLSGKIPSDYATKHCLQVLKDWGYDLGDSHGNEGNPATPDGSVGESNDCSNSSGDDSQVKSVKLSDCNTEEDSDYHSDSSCKNEENPANNSSNYPNKHNDDQALRDDPGYGSGDDDKTISTKSIDCDRKDEDSSCSLSDYLFLEDSLLAKLGIPLTTDEQELIDKFCEEIRGITTQNKQESEESILESIEKIVNEYLGKGLRLNSSCSNGNEKGDKETVTNLILEEIEGIINERVKPRDGTKAYIGRVNDITDQDDDNEDKVSGIVENITSWLLLKGGKARQKFFFGNTELAQDYGFHYMNDLNKQYKDRKEELKSIACGGIVNKSKQTHEYDFKAEIDNVYFYVKYPQDSIIEPVKILNNEKAKKLNLKVGILQIGESIVRVEGTKDGKRNYTDVLEGSIKMSFTTEVGEISIYLSPSKKDGNKIKVEVDEENKARFNKLKDKSSLGKNCLLERENVSEVISKNFKMSDSVSTESIETIKGVPFTDFTQACLQQINTSVKGR